MLVSQAETIGPIQVIPQGLTGFLQVKQTGKMPGELTELLYGVLELRDWLFASRRNTEIELFGTGPNTTVATGGIGFRGLAPTPVIPQNQYWYVWSYTLLAATAAATDVLSFAPAISIQGGQTLELLGPTVFDQVTARQRNLACFVPSPFWAGPGDTFGFWVTDVSTAGITVAMRIRATVLTS